MTQQDSSSISMQLPSQLPTVPDEPTSPDPGTIPVTRTQLRVKENLLQHRTVIIGGGALIVVLLLFVAVSSPHNGASRKPPSQPTRIQDKGGSDELPVEEHSLLPITDSGQPRQTLIPEDVDENTVERTATRSSAPANPSRPSPSIREKTLAAVPPFPEPWQPPAYSQHSNVVQEVPEKSEQDAFQKSSLAYVRSAAAATTNPLPPRTVVDASSPMGLGLPVGTRLRARLESAVSTGLQASVVAAIEYNYERAGEIIVPAGAKAIGHIQQADRSGYVTIQFDTLMMPDESTVPIQAIATDLNLGPPRGQVEGRNGGKNLLLRSLTGIGQAGAVLVGHGSLDQPLSEGDMLRERLSNNIGQASDEQISRLSLSEHVVVTIPADTPIYVILEKRADTERVSSSAESSKVPQPSSSNNIDDLRQ